MFQRYKVFFLNSAAPRARRSGRDANAETLRRFASANGLVGELERIFPSSAFGIVEVSCTPHFVERVMDLPEVETVVEA